MNKKIDYIICHCIRFLRYKVNSSPHPKNKLSTIHWSVHRAGPYITRF